MTTRLALLAGVILLTPGLAQGQPSEIGDEALPLEREGYQHLFNYDFEEAEQVFQRLADQFPEYAAGPYGRATIAYMRIAQPTGAMRGSSHRGDRFWDQSGKPDVSPEAQTLFDSSLAESAARCESVLARDRDNVLALYYLGATDALKAAWETTVARSYFGGSRAIRRAVKHHRRVLEVDPEFTDAYQVPGVYDYAIATLPRALRMLARLFGVRGDKERGLDWLARTAHEGERSRWGALWSLAIFMQREDRLDEALTAVRTLREQFPKNPDYALERSGSTCTTERPPRHARSYSPSSSGGMPVLGTTVWHRAASRNSSLASRGCSKRTGKKRRQPSHKAWHPPRLPTFG